MVGEALPGGIAPLELDRTLFGSFDAFDEIDQQRLASLFTGSPAELGSHDIVMGHFALSTLEPAFRPAEIATVLREPRSRVLSHYTYWKSWDDGDHEAWSPYRASGRAVVDTWAEFLTDPAVASQIDNVATRLLLCPHPDIPADDLIDRSAADALADLAIGRLDSLGHADVIERGQACWAALSSWIGTPLIEQRQRVTAPDRIEVDWASAFDPAASEALADRTQVDRLLWHHVATRRGIAPDASAALAEAAWARQVASVAAAPAAAAARRCEERAATLEARADELEAALHAWETSSTARLTAPVRRAAASLRRTVSRRR